MDYPAGRTKFYANQVIRLLGKTCAANDIGLAAVWLVTQIVMTEDAAKYRRAVTFYDGQLMQIVGVNSQKTLALARNKAVEAGWLAYEPGFKGKAGQYFVTIPQAALDIDDHPMDEGSEESEEKCHVNFTSNQGTNLRGKSDEPTGQRETNLQGKGQTILPVPVPVPNSLTRATFLTSETSEGFERFWSAYPRKTSPDKAWEVWQAKVYTLGRDSNRSDAEVESELARIAEQYAMSPAGMPPPTNQPDYRPEPHNWLLKGCFKEDPSEWQRGNTKPEPRQSKKKTRETAEELKEYFSAKGFGSDAK